MNVNVVIKVEELANPHVHNVDSDAGQTLVFLGKNYGNCVAWVTAAEASSIAAVWAGVAVEVARIERERKWPTLEEVTADRDDALAAEAVLEAMEATT